MQKKTHTKRILSAILAVIFAFAPIFFAGCNFNPDDSGGSSSGGSSGGGGTISTNYKIGDYLNSIKVSYSVSGLSSDTQNEDIKEYANQIISLTQMLAADTMVGLLQQYSVHNQSDTTDLMSINVGEMLLKNVSKSLVPYSLPIEDRDSKRFVDEADPDKTSYVYSTSINVNGNDEYFSFVESVKDWEYIDLSSARLSGMLDYFNKIYKENYSNKLTYAILSIVDKFDNVSESDFDTTYKAFLNDYDAKAGSSSTDFAKLSENLALNVKHSGLYANSLESKAFKQFILDRVIGENLVNKDNQLFQVFDEKTKQYVDVSSSSTEKFRGETFYYNPNASVPTADGGTPDDITYYINGYNAMDFPTCDQLNERLKLIYEGNSETTGTGVKLWQDIDGDNAIEFSESIGNMAKDSMYINGNPTQVFVPKYRALVGFRNYDYTVEKIIDMVLTDTTNKIQVKNGSSYETISSDTNYPVIANVFSKNYSYSAVEVKGVGSDNSTSCKLSKQAYKSVLLAMKDRTKMQVKNSIGTIYLLLESSTGVKVNVSMYARYYRKGSGFAYFGEGEDETTFYKFPNASGEVNGPYGIDFSSRPIKDGCLFELEFESLFENAKFKNSDGAFVSNNQTFDYTYTNKDKETKTIPIYEIKPFPEDYAKSTDTSHASIYTGIDYKTKPVYDAQDIKGSTGSLYAYSENNLAGVDGEYEFIELMFVTDNDNPFTFGFTGFVPQTELYY